jgi:hypothetical protein
MPTHADTATLSAQEGGWDGARRRVRERVAGIAQARQRSYSSHSLRAATLSAQEDGGRKRGRRPAREELSSSTLRGGVTQQHSYSRGSGAAREGELLAEQQLQRSSGYSRGRAPPTSSAQERVRDISQGSKIRVRSDKIRVLRKKKLKVSSRGGTGDGHRTRENSKERTERQRARERERISFLASANDEASIERMRARCRGNRGKVTTNVT